MSQNKKMLKCRVCGKMYEACAYCDEHRDVFRWRNFACSLPCAKKYMRDTIEYRKKQHESANKVETVKQEKVTAPVLSEVKKEQETPTPKKKYRSHIDETTNHEVANDKETT